MFLPTQFMQSAWVVPDLEAAMQRWIDVFRVGPFFINHDVKVDKARHRGRPTAPPIRIALAQAGPLQIELIEQAGDQPSVYRDSVPFGTEAFHHIAAFVDDVPGEIARYRAMGVELAYEGFFGEVHVAYLDTRAQMGIMVELFNHKPVMDDMFARIAAASVGWDGSRPIRDVSEAFG